MTSKTPTLSSDRAAASAYSARWLITAFALCLLQGRGGHAQQSLTPRLEVTGASGIAVGSDFFALQGTTVKFYCYCGGYDNVDMLYNDEVIRTAPCELLLHTVNASYNDQGLYACRAQSGSESPVVEKIGNMTVIDDSVVVAEPMQYGIINTPTSLNCSTTLNEFKFEIVTYWNEVLGETTQRLSGRPQFNTTNISHEGVFTCEVFISTMGIMIEKTITFSVIVPPKIFIENEEYTKSFSGNARQFISVRFESRSPLESDMRVTWYKNEVPLLSGPIAANIQTTAATPPHFITRLTFDPTRRSDSAQYQVSVENDFHVIPLRDQVARAYITVRVMVPPAIPVINVESPFDIVSWTVPAESSEDERADNFTISLNFTHNGSLAEQLTVAGHLRAARLNVVPGMNYTVSVTARNQDGAMTSESVEFTTPPGAPSIPLLQVRRLSNSSIELIVSLSYTGGGDITFLDVSFREIGTKEWILIGTHNTESMSQMTWKALVIDERFIGIGVEFEVAVKNVHGHRSQPVTLFEPLELPEAPSIESISISTNSLMIEVTISSVGTSPILSLMVEFTAPESFVRNFTGPFIKGETYDLEISGLRDNTQYSFTISAVNYQGRGTATSRYNSTTAKLPPIPSYGIILIAISVAVLIVLIILALAIISVLKHRQHRQKQTYKFNHQGNMEAENKELEGSHEMVKRGTNPYTQHNPSLPSSRSILSDSTGASSGYIPTCTSPPFSPGSGCGSSSIGPTSILRISDPAPIDRYRYETCSSTTSNSMQSEESDAGIRYTYNISPSPPVEIDTPDLRAQSSYSVATSTTRMTSSTSSTRESLAYTHESNATVV